MRSQFNHLPGFNLSAANHGLKLLADFSFLSLKHKALKCILHLNEQKLKSGKQICIKQYKKTPQ